MLTTLPLEISEFHGGITDHYIDGPLNKYQEGENFLITDNKKLDTRHGSTIFDEAYAQIPVGLQRVSGIIELIDDIILVSGSKVYYYDSGTGWNEIQGPSGNSVLGGSTINDVPSWSIWNDQLFITSSAYNNHMKIYRDSGGTFRCVSAGLPVISPIPVLTPTAGANSYIYAFHYYYEYTVGEYNHVDAGPVVQKLIENADAPDVNAIAISAIPVLVNTGLTNFDTVAIKVKIFRTTNAGTTLYEIGEVPNGTTVFSDTQADTSIIGNVPIYTTGGVLDNDPPPLSKVVHAAGRAMYYANVKVDTSIIKSRIYQSVLSDADSVPAANFVELNDEVVAMNSYMDRPIALCSDGIYRLDGVYDEFGDGGIEEVKISDTIGCISALSVVQTPWGLFFASREGFAYTDGFKCHLISKDFFERYRGLVETEDQRKRIYGTFDRETNRVWWSVQRDTSPTSDCDYCYVLDVRWGISENCSFTNASGRDSFRPTSLLFRRGSMLRGDQRGYIFNHTADFLSDPVVDNSIAASLWGTQEIQYNYVSVATRFDQKYRSYVPKMIFSAKNTSNLSVQINSVSDVGNKKRSMKPVRWRGNLVWNDPLFYWNDPTFTWGVQGYVEQSRRFFSDDLRCTYKQLQITNADVILFASDDLGLATVDGVANTIVLEDPLFNFPVDLAGHKIRFEDDQYTQLFEVASGNTTTLTVIDPNNSLPTGGGKKWELVGKPKDEVLSLLAVIMMYAALGQTHDRFQPSSEGGNA